MKYFFFLSLLFYCLSTGAQRPNPAYDSTLARKLGADERGMKMYVLVLLKSGPNNVTDSLKRTEMFAGHFKNIHRMADMGKLIVAGPLDKNDLSYRGIFILDVQSFDEAKTLLQGDPTISGKIFEPVYLNWYGSAALREYIPSDEKIRKSLD
ncbi:MAG TPA: YciI family protein [Bacteroidales bacterium]|jgi:uncharacterized protein YciI|nr:YciI family protein [Bacteroidales bacterium]